MATTATGNEQQQAELFIQKIAAKLPVQSTSESTVIGLYEGIVESLGKSTIRKTILADLDHFYSVFEIEIKKQLEVTQTTQSSSAVYKNNDSELSKLANGSFPVTKSRILLGTVDVNFVNSKVLISDDSDDDVNTEMHILISVQCAQLTASQTALTMLNVLPVVKPSSNAENLSKALISRLVLKTAWSTEETESAGCLWGYSMINASLPMRLAASTTLSILDGYQKGIWVFCLGFTGFWGSKSAVPAEDETMKLVSNLLDVSSVNNLDDCEYSDIILCLTVLFLWVKKQPKSEYTERIISTLLVQISTVSYTSRGSVQLFWSDALLPIFESRLELKAMNKKVRTFSNTGNQPLGDLLVWVGETPGLVVALGQAMCDLIGESSQESEDVGEIEEEDVEKEVGKSGAMEIMDLEEEPLPVAESRKRKVEYIALPIPLREKKSPGKSTEVVEVADDDSAEMEIGSYEINVTGDPRSVLSYMAEDIEEKSKAIAEAPTPRKSARNQNKKNAEVEEKSEMELELEILTKKTRQSTLPKKISAKKSFETITVQVEEHFIVNETDSTVVEAEIEKEKMEIEIIKAKKSTPKKAKKEEKVVDEEIVEPIKAKKSTPKKSKVSEKIAEIEEVEEEVVESVTLKGGKSTPKKATKKAEKIVEAEIEEVDKEIEKSVKKSSVKKSKISEAESSSVKKAKK